MDWAAFFEIHKGLEREGPGLPEDVAWAVAQAALSGPVRVLDAGCGPGADLGALAQLLPEAQLKGIEAQEQFVTEARARLARYGDRVRVELGDMAEPGGPFDLIWCAGALYFLGVTEGLTRWRNVLAPQGWVAFSEPVLLNDAPSGACREFWEEYPAITGSQGIRDRIARAGFEVSGYRLIVGDAWQAYYDPLRARVDALRAADPGPELAQMLDLTAREIALWEAARDEVAYALFLVRPI